MAVRAKLHKLRLRLHLAWLAVAPAVFVVLIVAGVAYFPLSAPYWDDPCCHVQFPGAIALAYGGGGLLFAHLRRKEFKELLEMGGKSNFQAHEKRLGELAKQLPQAYRERLKAKQEELGGTRGEVRSLRRSRRV